MILDAIAVDHLAARQGVAPRWYVWIVAKDRSTGDPAPAGFWTGRDNVTLSIDGETRTYLGLGALLTVEPLTFETGPVVREQTVGLTMIDATVENLIRGYDCRLAPVDIHLGFHDPSSLALLSLTRAFRGEVDRGPVRTPPVGGSGGVELALVSSARAMTRKVNSKFSDASFQLRDGDRIARYIDVSGSVQVVWGSVRG